MELIDANALREYFKISKECVKCYWNNKDCSLPPYYPLRDICSAIDEIPTVDAIPVEWLRSQLKDNPNDIESAYDDICISELIEKWQKEQAVETR